ncbi:MAG: 3-deoxy-manno-octulosonate cytidylyltransferase [Bacteroidales bacterium]|nr:3-deoxy-manno-octulosonate cytidylyltransferase [Bacteroidales bacterium]MDY0215746.1 3-deoxy-manno-octulosonate cytidylyltransferase [Bacteroidales bacterium]
MQAIGIIPARYNSTRFPGKPLHPIQGVSMIERVYRRAKQANLVSHMVVATDDERIFQHVRQFGGEVFMSSENHQSGTDRCSEVLDIAEKEFGITFDIVVNIQGDEPLIDANNINVLVDGFSNSKIEIATLKRRIFDKNELFSKNVVKVITDIHNKAIYFSRYPLPFIANTLEDEWLIQHDFYKHIGIYAYRTEILRKITNLATSNLENCEKLEQLRWIENGFSIYAFVTNSDVYSVDVIDDVKKIERLLNNIVQ